MAVRDPMLMLVALSVAAGTTACGREASSPAAPPAAFAVEEATIDGIHAAIRSGRTTCSAIVQAYIDRARLQRRVHESRDGRRRRHGIRHRLRARWGATDVSDADNEGIDDLSGLGSIPRQAARLRPHGADDLRPDRGGADGHACGHSQRRTTERARNAQHPRGAFSHVQRRVRCASLVRTVARRRAGRLRGVSAAARCVGARGRARCPVRPESGPGGDADVLRRHGRQGSARHQGYADHG